jgi:sporulation protein YlmC with PRC-barrel domain
MSYTERSKSSKPERRFRAVAKTTGVEIGFVKLSDSGYVLENPEQDIRGKDVYHVDGEQIGSVDDVYIDRRERKVRFLEVGAGGFLGLGERRFLIPVESVTEVGEDRVTIEPGSEPAEGELPLAIAVVPPTAEHPRYPAYDYTDPSRADASRDRYPGGGMGLWG